MQITNKPKTQRTNKVITVLLTVMMVLGLMPGMSLTAYAADPYVSIKNTTTVVHFDSKDWYLIDYDSSTVTLLAKECVAASQYNSRGTFVEYSQSTVKTAVDTYYTVNFSDDAKAAVSGNEMFLLTLTQANGISNADVMKCQQFTGTDSNNWWLGWVLTSDAKVVNGDSGGFNDFGIGVINKLGVRPALKLNLSSVIFSSVNLSGGANATTDGGGTSQNYFDVGSTRSAMTTVTYTAESGCVFPKTSDYYTTTNGIKVERTSDTVVTVSGTPTANTTITIPDADAHAHSYTYSANGATITATCNGEGTCDITEGLTLTISAPTGNLVYDGTTTYPATLSTGYNTTAFPGTYSISYTKDGSAYSGVPKDAGTYTASVTAGTEDAAKTASVSYIVAKAVPTITTAPTAGAITYGQTLANSTLTGGETSVAGTFAWKYSTVAPAVADSRTTEYDVVFTPTDGNYGTAECKVKLTVNKADSAVTKAPVAKTLTYTGSAQALVTAGTATGGTLQYAVGTDATTVPTSGWDIEIPSKTEAGTYYVWYRVEGDQNWSDADSFTPVKVDIKEQASNTSTDSDPSQSNTSTSTDSDPSQSNTGTSTDSDPSQSNTSTSTDSDPSQSNTGTSTDSEPAPVIVTPVYNPEPVAEKVNEVPEPSVFTRKNKDGSETKIEIIWNADGTTTVITENKQADGTTVVKEETRDSKGNGTLKIEKKDADGNLLSSTEGTIKVNKKGTETIKSTTKNSDGSVSEKTQKTYKRDPEADNIKKVTISEKKKDAAGNTETIKTTALVGVLGDATISEKSTYNGTGADGKMAVTVKEGRDYSLSVNGRLKLMSLASDGEKLTIPESIELDGMTRALKSIGKNAMKGNKTVKEVVPGENITTICTGAFKNCKNLELIELKGSVKKIYKNAFKGIAENAKFVIKASEEDFERIVELLKESGVSDTVTFERVET